MSRLTDAQFRLLEAAVEAEDRWHAERGERPPFVGLQANDGAGGVYLKHPGLPNKTREANLADIEELDAQGFIRLRWSERIPRTPRFHITNEGRFAVSQCAVCSTELSSAPVWTGRDSHYLQCPNCGVFELPGLAGSMLPANLQGTPTAAAILSDWIRANQDPDQPPVLNTSTIAEVLAAGKLPPAAGRSPVAIETHDVFLCHASEDKPTVLDPICSALDEAAISYWIDRAEVRWGDSLTEKVNEGLRISRYVLVVLSESFLGKKWPERELNAALGLEASSGNVKVLPLLCGEPEARKRILATLPLLADKLHHVWDGDAQAVVRALEGRLAAEPIF